MSIPAQTWALKQPLKIGPKTTLIVLAWHADECGICWPSQQALADETGLCERQVRRCLRHLEEGGKIAVVRPASQGRGQRTVYRVLVPGASEKGDISAPLSTPKRGTLRPPSQKQKADICDTKRRTFTTEKADIYDTPPTPPYKDEPLIEPSYGTVRMAPSAETAPVPEAVAPPKVGAGNPPVSKGVKPLATRGSRIPEDWQPSEADRTAIAAECPDLDFDRATTEFKDYWVGVAGQRGVKLSWGATWRNACRWHHDQGRFLKSGPKPATAGNVGARNGHLAPGTTPAPHLTPTEQRQATSIQRSREFTDAIASGEIRDMNDLVRRQMRELGLNPVQPGEPGWEEYCQEEADRIASLRANFNSIPNTRKKEINSRVF